MNSAVERVHISHVEMKEIVKTFPGVMACNHIDFDIRSGEVHSLLGENGAGKSTLMKMLYGMLRPDGGEILLDGRRAVFHSPADAISAGIGMIHQHFMLVPTMTVAQNVALGQPSSRGFMLDLDVVSDKIRKLSAEYGLRVNPDDLVSYLSVGEQQRVEIIKALYLGASIIILDEPTAVLTPQEVDDLFVVLRNLVAEGHGLVFISHKLHEVTTLSTRVSVLRDGHFMGTRDASCLDRDELVRMMVGRELKEITPRGYSGGAERLKVRDLHVQGDRGTEVVCGVTIDLHAGEILGIAGVAGNGQRELAEALIGVRVPTSGTILLEDADITTAKLNNRINAGMAMIPEERMQDGAIKDFSVQENVFLHDHSDPEFSAGIFLRFKKMEAHARRLIQDFKVKTPNLDTPIRNLSGGNIQKVIMARELSRKPSVLIASQPTRGVDIGASEYIRERLLLQRDNGTAVLLISEDLDELFSLSDRIAVMYEGRIMGLFNREDTDVQTLGFLMAGLDPKGESLVGPGCE
ncbi:MAG: ABC transporter ATP-binding protein [Spirochaetaceae bacterium]|nr:MAG: ABC transporter ATP-binding protein [Spirochaetaceae bacterium]